jgi:hypothetical protein
VRLATIRAAGEAAVPFTSGILIGIGETRRERIEALLHLRELDRRYGHLQEIIVQNFRAKAGTRMAGHVEPPLTEHLWTVAVARILFGAAMNIQAPPNLQPGALARLIAAGINDWGGVSPVTPDHVNPERPWPALDALARATAQAGKILLERLAVYPGFVARRDRWIAPARAGAGTGAGIVDAHPATRGEGCGVERSRDRGAVLRARGEFARSLRGRRRAARAGLRRSRELRRHPQHQLHQCLPLPLRVLRLFQGQDARAPARASL